jgi:hypothetical protein
MVALRWIALEAVSVLLDRYLSLGGKSSDEFDNKGLETKRRGFIDPRLKCHGASSGGVTQPRGRPLVW